MPKIQVIHLIHTIEFGGIETIVLNWLRSLDRDRFSNHLVCFANPGRTEQPFVDAAERRGFHVDTIPWHRGKPIFRAARALCALQKKYQAEVIHTHNTYAHLVGLFARKCDPVALVGSVYVWGDFGFRRNLLQRVDAWVLRHFDQVTSQCQKTHTGTLRRGVLPEKSSILESGIYSQPLLLEAERRDALRKGWQTAAGDFVLLNVARLNTEKAQGFLLECFREIVDKHPHAKLWIAGVGPLEAVLKRRCAELGLSNRVVWLGFVVELEELFAMADLIVHPSIDEGVPLALCQAMAAGKPIVATAVGGVPEIIQDRHTGRLVQSQDAESLVAAINELIAQPELAVSLGQAAQRFIAEDYQLGNSTAKLEALYQAIVRPS